MFHLVAVGPSGRLLVHTHAEAIELVRRLAIDPGLDLQLLPDHLHIVAPGHAVRRVRAALAAWARHRTGVTGRPGPHVRWLGVPSPLSSERHVRRTLRYVHLQARRDDLVPDALAWPHGTLRSRLGLLAQPLVPPVHQPHRYWSYLRADADHPSGPLPAPAAVPLAPADVRSAASCVGYVDVERLHMRGEDRARYLRALRELGHLSPARAAAVAGVHRTTVARVAQLGDHESEQLRRIAADPRFPAIGGPLPISRGVSWRSRSAERQAAS